MLDQYASLARNRSSRRSDARDAERDASRNLARSRLHECMIIRGRRESRRSHAFVSSEIVRDVRRVDSRSLVSAIAQLRGGTMKEEGGKRETILEHRSRLRRFDNDVRNFCVTRSTRAFTDNKLIFCFRFQRSFHRDISSINDQGSIKKLGDYFVHGKLPSLPFRKEISSFAKQEINLYI